MARKKIKLIASLLTLGTMLCSCDFKLLNKNENNNQNQTETEKVTINVVNGSGSGIFEKGKLVTITAVEQAGKTFVGWKNGDLIVSTSRKKEFAYARQMLMYILRTDFNISLQIIGDNIGARDHTTVLHGIEKIETMLKSDDLTKSDYQKISKIIKNSQN